MSDIPHISDIHSYTSTRVFNGTRPLSAARVKQLQDRFSQTPPKKSGWSVLTAFIIVAAVVAVVGHVARLYGH